MLHGAALTLLAQQNYLHVLLLARFIGFCPLQAVEHVNPKMSHAAFHAHIKRRILPSDPWTLLVTPLNSLIDTQYKSPGMRVRLRSLLQDPTFWRSITNSLMNLAHNNDSSDAANQSNPFAHCALAMTELPCNSTMCKEG